MKIHLVDATYELFRAYFAIPAMYAPNGQPVSATRGLAQTLLSLLRDKNVSHIACAFDHVIESFRNALFSGYKTGSGVPEELISQFELAEQIVASLGITVWPMNHFEADDAIATAIYKWKYAKEVQQIVICSPDKDLTQMVDKNLVVCLDRRRNLLIDESAVINKFGVLPSSIPDYLALVGDRSDGIPGVSRWGHKVSSQMLSRYQHIENIPEDPSLWTFKPRGFKSLAKILKDHRGAVTLYKTLTTLRTDVPITEQLHEIRWNGIHKLQFTDLCHELGLQSLLKFVPRPVD